MLNLEFTSEAWEEYQYWQTQDKKKLKRINKLIKDCLRNPSEGIGKPEPLKYSLEHCWSRRIDDTNRLVYSFDDSTLLILQLRYHY